VSRILSGIQPTGGTHLGNYLGAVRWWVADQRKDDCFYCVVDLHALTVPGDPGQMRADTLSMATLLLAAGLDPDACTLFVQSHVPAHTQLTWLLECTASMGELRRMTQFKDKAVKGGEDAARVGLFTYPVLMAADILLYQADRVPVGDDQRQHLELTRDLAQRFNRRYGEVFTIPSAAIPPPGRGARIMDLQEPTNKMSKTGGTPQGTIGFLDDLKAIERKVKRAVTDTDDGPDAVRYDPEAKPGVSNLLEILAAIRQVRPEDLAAGFGRYGDLKEVVAEEIIAVVEPIQRRYRELSADPGEVLGVLRAGAKKADSVAQLTLARASEAMGLLLPV
jgi:tryptophanyl-tRNA synthetase